MATDKHLKIVIRHIGTFHDDIIADHDRRGHRQIKREVLICLVFGFGFEVISISTGYFSPNLGIICLKCFHGLPFGSLRKKRTLSMIFSFL